MQCERDIPGDLQDERFLFIVYFDFTVEIYRHHAEHPPVVLEPCGDGLVLSQVPMDDAVFTRRGLLIGQQDARFGDCLGRAARHIPAENLAGELAPCVTIATTSSDGRHLVLVGQGQPRRVVASRFDEALAGAGDQPFAVLFADDELIHIPNGSQDAVEVAYLLQAETVLTPHPGVAHFPLDRLTEPGEISLQEVVVSSGLHGLDRYILTDGAGDDDEGQVGIELPA